jgi:hypothetical protein
MFPKEIRLRSKAFPGFSGVAQLLQMGGKGDRKGVWYKVTGSTGKSSYVLVEVGMFQSKGDKAINFLIKEYKKNIVRSVPQELGTA